MKEAQKVLRKQFLLDAGLDKAYRMLSVAVQLPNGAIETITNYHEIPEKIKYYVDVYDEHFCNVHNRDIVIVNYMLV